MNLRRSVGMPSMLIGDRFTVNLLVQVLGNAQSVFAAADLFAFRSITDTVQDYGGQHI